MLGASGGLAAALGLAAHHYPSGSSTTVAVSAFSSYLVALAPLSALLLLLGRRWIAAGLAAALTAGAVAALAPTYAGDQVATAGRPLTVLTANVKLGQAGAAGVVAAVERSGADVVLLQELTPALRRQLADAGLDAVLPHSVVEPWPGAEGIGLWSRYRLADETRHDELTFPAVSARLVLDDEQPGPVVLTLHAAGPWPQAADDWVRDLAKLPALLDRVAREADVLGSPVLIGGDLNATWGNAQFRGLLQDGYRDAAEVLGAPWTTTFPAVPRAPALIGIDHVLVRGAGPRELRTVGIPGSDHRGVVATVVLPAA
ncbi:endonuclease/exonuclease/phosphatase family protein [Geodermatophilus marinus]|uniref:endonuclease/exonuclease/phosphatase family protein n=1 Tax=Geodermatophilus sp. LHW52908 TaxID=2303986 RepID=UPI001314EBDF|nr:endonuclease/exonuclease/phosphatase family protein [Geodermatophilus sp. LHW52908]